MSIAPSLPEPLAAALDALSQAVARAEHVVDGRKGGFARAADGVDELAAMQDDRERLARELAQALEAGRALAAAHGEAERRVAAAAALVERALADCADDES